MDLSEVVKEIGERLGDNALNIVTALTIKGAIDKAKQRFDRNRDEFSRRLERHMADLKEEGLVSDEQIVAALENPDFIMFLQRAIESAARTDRQDIHDLLSRLVEERLQASPESLLSLVNKRACEVVSLITPNQLRMLGLAATITYPASNPLDATQAVQWLEQRISPLIEVKVNQLDYAHLESLSCINRTSRIFGLSVALQAKFGGHLNFDEFVSTQLGQDLECVWAEGKIQGEWGLNHYHLTTVGLLLGVMVGDEYSGTKTNFEGWGEEGTLVSNFLFP